jgi:hypothetical protein
MRIWVFSLLVMAACRSASEEPHRAEEESVIKEIIRGEPYCGDCEIQLRGVATLGDPADPAPAEDAMTRSCGVARLSSGEFLVGVPVGGEEVLVYESGGPALRVIGRRGGGPGEFRGDLSLVVDAGDTIHVLERNNGEIQTFPAEGDFIRGFPLSGRMDSFVLLSSGEFLLLPVLSKRAEETEFLFHVYSRTGTLLRRIEEYSEIVGADDQWVINSARPDGFWEGWIGRYSLNLRDQEGKVVRTLTREVEWFPPLEEVNPGFPFTAQLPPFLWQLRQDLEGRLWVYAIVPDPHWKPTPQPERDDWNVTPATTRHMFDTMIEVIDLESGRSIVSGRFDDWLGLVCGSSLVYAVVETESGDTQLRIFEQAVRHRGGKGN